MKLALSAVIGAAAALAACSDYPPPPPPGPPVPAVAAEPMGSSCFHTRDILNHTIADDHTLYIRTRSNAIFRADMVGACLAAASSDDPLIIREPPGVPYVCRAVDLDISIGHNLGVGGMATPCIVDRLTQLTPAEIAALPPGVRP
jgi:hypothetical protein